MFEFLKRKRNKQAENAEIEPVHDKKKEYQERKRLITDFKEKYMAEQRRLTREQNEKEKAEIDFKNSHCPICNSDKVVDKIIRLKGDLHGEGHTISHFASDIFSSSYMSSGESKIDGKMDTVPVRKCNDCGNEWYPEEFEPNEEDDIFSSYDSFLPGFLYRRLKEYTEMEYDPKDFKEECNSLDEKKAKYIEKYSTIQALEPYRNVPRYMIETALYDEMLRWRFFSYGRNEEFKRLLNIKDDDDKYSYKMSDELWEAAKKIIGWKYEIA